MGRIFRLRVFLVFVLLLAACARFGAAADKGKQLLDQLTAREAKLKDYHCFFEYYEVGEKGDGKTATYEFWALKPNSLKMVVLDGENKGAKLSWRPDADAQKVHVKKGILPLTLSKDDKRLKGFFESAWAADIKEIVGWAKGGKFKIAGVRKIKGRDASALEIATGPGAKFTKMVLWIDKKDNLLLQYEYYRDSVLQQRKTWYDIELNRGLKSEDLKP